MISVVVLIASLVYTHNLPRLPPANSFGSSRNFQLFEPDRSSSGAIREQELQQLRGLSGPGNGAASDAKAKDPDKHLKMLLEPVK